MRPATGALLALAGVVVLPLVAHRALGAFILLGDDPKPWLRQEAYGAAATGVLIGLAQAAGNQARVARDLTQVGSFTAELAPRFLPCARPLSVLGDDLLQEPSPQATTPQYLKCEASPGPLPPGPQPTCRRAACIVVGVTPETWSDPEARRALTSTLGDHAEACRLASLYANNHAASAAAAGCTGRWRPDHVYVAVTPRRERPCTSEPVPMPSGTGWRVRCEPRSTALVEVAQGRT